MAGYREDSAGMARLQREVFSAIEEIGDQVALDARRYAAVDTGLMKSRTHAMDVEPVGTGFGCRVRIVARTHYAKYVEMGTRYMRARPFLRAALFTRRSR